LENLSNKDQRQQQKAEQSRKSIQNNLGKIDSKKNEILKIENSLNSFNNDKIDFWKDFCTK